MEVRLLGPVELWGADGEIALGPPQQRLVLAALTVAPGEPVTVADLVARVWGDRRPGDARNVLQTHVSRLRGLLAPAAGISRTRVIRRSGDGYLLAVGPEQVDLCRARQLMADARRVAGDAGTGDREAGRLAGQAVALRRGTPLAGLAGDWAAQARAGIDREWLAWQVERCEGQLRLGAAATVVGPLSAMLADHPLDERLAELLMLALYRSGQQAEALRMYAGIRRRLVDELGDDPGARLQQLHQQVLRRDPDPDHPVPAGGGAVPAGVPAPDQDAGGSTRPAASAPTGWVRPMQLPPDVTSFTGRTVELRKLDALLDTGATSRPVAVISAVAGMAGVGKTALAIHWGHRLRDRFPDGQLYVDLRGYATGRPRSPASVLAKFLRSLAVAADRVPVDLDEAAALYRSLLADRTVLIVLDNAAGSDQVRPLLPGAGGSVVVVTSRARLSGLVVREGAYGLDLDVLPELESISLLSSLLGPDRATAELDAVAALARRCGHLPLALRVAAASTPTTGRIADQVARLAERGTLPMLGGSGEVEAAVPAVFDLSYDRLPEPTQRAFRLLGLMPGPDLTAQSLAALADTTPAQAEAWLAELAQASLVKPSAPGRYTCHDLLREYAVSRVRAEDAQADRRAALGRLFQFCLGAADAASRLLYPFMVRLPPAGSSGPGLATVGFRTPAEAVAWLDAERLNLVAATEHAAVAGEPEMAWRIADTVRAYLFYGMHLPEGIAVAQAGLAAAESAGSRSGQAAARLQLATLLCYGQDQYPDAIEHARQAVALCRDSGWLDGQGAAHNLLGHACVHQGDLVAAVGHFEQAAELHQQTGSTIGLATVAHNLGSVHLDLGQLRQAAARTRQAAELIGPAGSPSARATALINLGQIHRLLGEFDLALECFRQAVELCRPVGDRLGEASGRKGTAEVYRDTGRHREALAAAEAALAIARNTGRLELEADCVRVRADALGLLGEHQQALDNQRAAVELARRAGYRYVEADSLLGLAQAHLWLGERRPAEAELGEALARARQCGLRIIEGRALEVLAGSRLDQGDAGQAVEHAEAALAAHRDTGHRFGEAHAHALLARAHRQLGHDSAAVEHTRQAEALCAELGLPGTDATAAPLAGTTGPLAPAQC